MAIKRCPASIDVVEAAKIRIRNVFRNGLPVYMSFSGGKDSLCLSQLVMNLIQAGEINPAQLTVQFIDEEAIFPCMDEKVREWRKKFMLVGAKFEWFCLEVKHYNCFNELSSDETFICWDRYKKDVWVRQPPSFAIRNHPLLRHRTDAYQDFLPRVCSDGVTITGIRTAESVQRLQNMAIVSRCGNKMTKRRQIFPLYDWKDNDVWLYLHQERVDIPEIYLFLWQSGANKRQLRVSQFFSIDTAKSLVKMNEYYPDLMERIVRREPNAYLAALYWDSKMISPLGTLQWVDRGRVKPNDYNPNKVSKQNLELLKQSILTNGWTLPIVVRPDFTIIDGFHRWTVAGEKPLVSMLEGKVPVVIVEHKDKSGNIYGTVTHNRARGTHLLEPMKAIVKELIGEGKTVDEIGKQLGMRPEEIFRLSEFSKEDFLQMMIKQNESYSKAEFITKI